MQPPLISPISPIGHSKQQGARLCVRTINEITKHLLLKRSLFYCPSLHGVFSLPGLYVLHGQKLLALAICFVLLSSQPVGLWVSGFRQQSFSTLWRSSELHFFVPSPLCQAYFRPSALGHETRELNSVLNSARGFELWNGELNRHP